MPVKKQHAVKGNNGGSVIQALIDAGDKYYTAHELSELLGLSTKAVTMQIRKGIESGEIESDGAARNRRYRYKATVEKQPVEDDNTGAAWSADETKNTGAAWSMDEIENKGSP